jgi:hypothetical protein
MMADDGTGLEAFTEPVVRVYTGRAMTLRAAGVPASAIRR